MMNKEEFAQAANYWHERDAVAKKMPREELQAEILRVIGANNTCALATGCGDFVRCTPIEYSYNDGCFWLFSEGGEKFRALAENANVSLAIYAHYAGFDKLESLQVMGRAEVVDAFSLRYNEQLAKKGLSPDAVRRMPHALHLICIQPSRFECLCAAFKKRGYDSRQTYAVAAK
ncbi:MAG: pyridoxamine 5'-phosphate oxidase family protein [Peptococcaceae bacterium]|nr:pyridoxamine 5'-phosphate oxidase family protein [Peptococcaceae bacterium]